MAALTLLDDSMSTLQKVLALFATVFILLVIKPLFLPLQTIPGPFLARFSRLWYLSKVWRGDFEKTNRRLHERYGTAIYAAQKLNNS